MFGGLAALIVGLLLIGKYYPGSGADVLDWKPTRSPELEAQNEIDDLEQMLAAANAKRRKRGETDLTEESLHARVTEDRALQKQWAEDLRARDSETADEEIAQVLAAKNASRRRRGLPELDADQFRAEIEAEAAAREAKGHRSA